MTRLRIYFGALTLFIGGPLLAYAVMKPEAPAWAFIASAAMSAAGVALLYPARWVE